MWLKAGVADKSGTGKIHVGYFMKLLHKVGLRILLGQRPVSPLLSGLVCLACLLLPTCCRRKTTPRAAPPAALGAHVRLKTERGELHGNAVPVKI